MNSGNELSSVISQTDDIDRDGYEFAFGITLRDLYNLDGLKRLDKSFLNYLTQANQTLLERLRAGRANPDVLGISSESELLMGLAPYLEDFLGILFNVKSAIIALSSKYCNLSPLYTCKRLFIQRYVLKIFNEGEARNFDGLALQVVLETVLGHSFTELTFANSVLSWLDNERVNARYLDIAARYAAWRIYTSNLPSTSVGTRDSVLFTASHVTADLNDSLLEKVETHAGICFLRLKKNYPLFRRDGFNLTDLGLSREEVLSEVHRCIFCHHRNKDYCSKGVSDKRSGEWIHTEFGRKITGCPLEESISEFQESVVHGNIVSALAFITINNPMVAGTGHRICNDCVVGCILNKNHAAINVPQTETRVLQDVLSLPYGFEIYSLLTRWNPLNLHRPLPQPPSNRKVLVVGLGPAGYTLSHHLMNDGHTVVAIDGLKIEPLPQDLSGVTQTGSRVPFRPIKDVTELWESLSNRLVAGFGGVAEYGITVRWDKNFLKVLRLLLERRRQFMLFGGVRMGGTLTPRLAFSLGFDHIALCSGSGKPATLAIENGLARGVRQASDFLMALQLTGAARTDSIANLQIRLPIVVIGGGLTAVDAATEALAYYPVQVEKFLSRYETLQMANKMLITNFNEEEQLIAEEFLSHARAIRSEKKVARREHREQRIIELLCQWGGVTITYRRSLAEAPSYHDNPEELTRAIEQGIQFAENVVPIKVELDQFGHAVSLQVQDRKSGTEYAIPARTIIVAIGTFPNTVLSCETQDLLVSLDGRYFQAINEDGVPVTPEIGVSKPKDINILTSIRKENGCAISFFGDQHPSFSGNVVTAMASAKQGYPIISRVLARCHHSSLQDGETLISHLNKLLRPVVQTVTRLAPTVVELVVHAPLATRMFQPGQFYRLQNYESIASTIYSTRLAMEGIALTGACVDKDRGLLSMIILETGGSSDLVSLLHPGEPVVVMGPTGTSTIIPPDVKTVLLAGGGLGNAVLFSIGQSLREKNIRVLYFSAYRTLADRYKVNDIESSADSVIWCCEEKPGFVPNRSEDKSFVGDIVSGIRAYACGTLGDVIIPLNQVEYIIVIGSDRMMAAVCNARHTLLSQYLSEDHQAIGSINSPMQCMMKAICAQCLQAHKNPNDKQLKVVFSCCNQDQQLDKVDFNNLHQRLLQQSTQEKLTRLWINHCLVGIGHRQLKVN